MRFFGPTNKQDIQNEVKAVAELCKPDTHKNIVSVFRCGKLPSGSYYYIDMELCDMNLEDYIECRWTPRIPPPSADLIGHSTGWITEIWKIMKDITRGLSFIHSNKRVHRDIKPRNGICSYIC
jgi:serine/threonine protein kinase